jgi:opacity protein-like surface antigen
MDFFPYGREWGGTLWVDGDLNLGPRFLQGLGVEAEARDLSLDRSASLPNDFRTDTLGGGPMYTWHFHRLRPYVKGIISYGSLDVYKHSYHFTWTEYAPGGGVEYRTFGNVFVRADYEYQAWFKVFGKNYTLDPNGWTFGAVYQFGHPHLRH